VRCALTGHVTQEMQDHYSNVGTEEKRTAIAGAVIPLGWGPAGATQDAFIVDKAVRGSHDPVTGYGQIEGLDRTLLARRPEIN